MILNVLTPHGAKFENLEVKAVTLPGELGEMQVLEGHEALMSALGIGLMRVEDIQGNAWIAAISGGYVEVLQDRVNCLVETCETADEIDLERAQAKLKSLNERLQNLEPGTMEYQSLQHSKAKAELRISLKQSQGNSK